ncbi:MAG: aminopeptidase P family protein [Bacteroidia bacterium]
MKNYIFTFCILISISLQAQVSPTFHAGRRAAVRELMPPNSVLVVFAADVKNRANDVDYQYHQDPNFYYLTGLNEPNAVLLLFKTAHIIDDVSTNEALYVSPLNAQDALWTASVLGEAKATKTLGITCFNNTYFNQLNLDTLAIKRVFCLNYDDAQTPTSHSLKTQLHTQLIANNIKPNKQQPNLWLAKLRQHKLPEEITLIQKAIDITATGFNYLYYNIDSTHTEHQAQAMVEYMFAYNGAQYQGYPSICGAGNNGTVLHYTANCDSVPAKQLLLIDAGAEYNNYTADITRTFAPNGKFTTEQKLIYELVLKAQQAGIDACVAGNAFIAPHRAAQNVIAQGLLDLGIIKNRADFDTYFMHGTSHYLGLDVHDAGMYGALQANEVITVEPGIYIKNGSPCDSKWWGIAIRIEDDVLITSQSPVIMSAAIPKDIATMEQLVQRKTIAPSTSKH